MNKLKYLIIPILVLGVTACDSLDFGGVNDDDDVITDANVQSLMAGGMNEFFTMTGRNYLGKPTLYVQYQSQYVYTAESRYGVVDGSWTDWYVQVLSNFDRIIEINSADSVGVVVRGYGAPVNQIGVSKIMMAYIWKRVTDTFGPIPYKEALNIDVKAPNYTGQEKIYKDLVKTLRAARDMLDPNKLGPTGDVVYGGNMMDWKKLANSLLMSLAIQMSNVYPNPGGYAAKVFNEALNHPAGVIDDLDEEMWYDYQKTSGVNNPYSAFRRPDYSLSEPFIDALKGIADDSMSIKNPTFSSDTKDPRGALFADSFDLPGRPYGLQYTPDISYAAISVTMTSPEAPLHFMTAAYTYLNRAEAAALGWTSEDAGKMLKKGIKMSFKSLDKHYLPGTDSLAVEGPAFAKARLEDAKKYGMLRVIREEKWVSLFPRGFQSWAEWRRTGVPGLIPAPDATNKNGKIPRRYIYPSLEPAVNNKNYKEAVNMLTPSEDSYVARFWWDVK